MNKLNITTNDGVASVVINNPPVNILTIDLINEVNAFVLSLKDDLDTKVVVFKSSNEKFFSALSSRVKMGINLRKMTILSNSRRGLGLSPIIRD